MKVIGYARVSTEKQEREGTSLESQTNSIKSYCDALGYELSDLVLEAETGTSAKNRKEFNKLIKRVLEDDSIEGIITFKLDRFARSLKDLVNIVDSLRKKGKFLICFGDNINTKDANSTLLMGILGSVAEWEAKKIKERIRIGVAEKAKKAGSSLSMEVITESEISSWIKDYDQGLSLRKIAEKYNRYLTTVARILKKEEVTDKNRKRVV